jgi:hypothetical protein
VIILKKIFDYFVWMMFFGLLLLGGIIYVSDRTYPGDKLYPFKLKFEEFTLATSKILNKQVDISIDLVSKRSKEVAKILTPKNSTETLNRLDTQVQTTAISISQISNPIEKKKAATKYIAQLNEVSTVLTEKQKEFLTPTPPVIQQPSQQQPIKNIIPTSTPKPENSSISEQINSSQETVQQAIEQMNNIESNTEIIPTPQKKEDKSDNNNSDKKNSDNQNKDNKKNEENKDNKDKKD